MTVVKSPTSSRGIEGIAPAGSTIIRGHGSLVMTAKVGDVWVVDGEVLGRVAATEYDHGRRECLFAVVPELVYWHLKLRFELKLEGYGELDAPLTSLQIPVHDPPVAWRVLVFAGIRAVVCSAVRIVGFVFVDKLPAEIPVLDSEPGCSPS